MSACLLDIDKVFLKYPHSEKPILFHLSYQVFPGNFIVILGPNGSGKSSFLKIINGQIKPTSGRIYFHDKPLRAFSKRKLSRIIKTLTQDPNDSLFMSLTLLENYWVIRQLQGYRENKKLAREYFVNHLQAFNPALIDKLHQPTWQLSGGEKQALALALVFLFPPQVLLLDEHTSALDPKSSETIMNLTQKLVEDYKMTCLLTTHDLTIAKNYGNRILALKNGEILTTIEEEKSRIDLEELFRICY